MTTYQDLSEAMAASPGHRMPLRQIDHRLHGRELEGVALGTITGPDHEPRTAALAAVDGAFLIGEESPLGFDISRELPRSVPVQARRYDDGCTCLSLGAGADAVTIDLPDDEAAWLLWAATGSDGQEALDSIAVTDRERPPGHRGITDANARRLRVLMGMGVVAAALLLFGLLAQLLGG